MKELQIIQQKLHSGKDKRNDFGKYNYRNAEGILENLKPILKETGCYVVLNDELTMVGDRIYITATATLINEKGESVSAQSMAREDEVLKGMSGGQITGATSSYARKYALCGLFAIDGSDAKDLDDVAAMPDKTPKSAPKETPKETAKETPKPAPTNNPLETPIEDMFDNCLTIDEVKEIWFKHEDLHSNSEFKKAANFAKQRIAQDND